MWCRFKHLSLSINCENVTITHMNSQNFGSGVTTCLNVRAIKPLENFQMIYQIFKDFAKLLITFKQF